LLKEKRKNEIYIANRSTYQYLKLVPLEAATNSSGPGSSKQSKLTLKYSELVIYFPSGN
jgi:hypothetical protein